MKRKRKISWPIIFILPFFITYFIFNLFPILFSFYISLTKWKGFGPMEFIGFRNYASLLKDTAFYRSLLNSIILVLEAMIPIQTLGLIEFRYCKRNAQTMGNYQQQYRLAP